jgi:hypothetical protein
LASSALTEHFRKVRHFSQVEPVVEIAEAKRSTTTLDESYDEQAFEQANRQLGDNQVERIQHFQQIVRATAASIVAVAWRFFRSVLFLRPQFLQTSYREWRRRKKTSHFARLLFSITKNRRKT